MNLIPRVIRNSSPFLHYARSSFNPVRHNSILSTWNARIQQYSSGTRLLPQLSLSSPGTMSNFATMVDSEAYLKQKKEVLNAVNSEIVTQPENKLFAVIQLGGRQHKVTVNDLIVVNLIPAELGSQLILKKVLLAGSENFTLIGRPLLSENDVKLTATVVEHTKLKKVVVFKKKRRKNYKRTKAINFHGFSIHKNHENLRPRSSPTCDSFEDQQSRSLTKY